MVDARLVGRVGEPKDHLGGLGTLLDAGFAKSCRLGRRCGGLANSTSLAASSHLEPVPPPSCFGHKPTHLCCMPPHHGGAPPGPSPGPRDASIVFSIFPTLLAAAIKHDPDIAHLDPKVLRCAFYNKWVASPPPPNDMEAASALLLFFFFN